MNPFQQNNPLVKAYLVIYLLLGAILIGIAGFMIIEHFSLLDAFYMTIITLGTVGFSEVHPLSPAGKIFTVFLIIAGLVIFAYFITQISRYFLDGEFIYYRKMYTMKKNIENLSGHTIICGFGRNGREAARILQKNKSDVVIIESDSPKLHEYAAEEEFLYIDADATRDETLLSAGIRKARAIISTLPDDAQNVFVCLTAKELNPGIKIISRATHVSSIRKLKNAGASNVIMPDKIGGAHMAMLVNNPDVEEFIDIMSTNTSDDFLIQEIEAGKSFQVGKVDCWQKTGATIIGIKSKDNNYILNPAPAEEVKSGDGVIIMGSRKQIEEAGKLIGEG